MECRQSPHKWNPPGRLLRLTSYLCPPTPMGLLPAGCRRPWNLALLQVASAEAVLGSGPHAWPPLPCVTFRRVAVLLWRPGQSPILPFACCVGLLRPVFLLVSFFRVSGRAPRRWKAPGGGGAGWGIAVAQGPGPVQQKGLK